MNLIREKKMNSFNHLKVANLIGDVIPRALNLTKCQKYVTRCVWEHNINILMSKLVSMTIYEHHKSIKLLTILVFKTNYLI